ncbi:MAG: hypothetical protein ACJA2W_000802 [Planctomycetota bacterium]|jgi:hypothetical protein
MSTADRPYLVIDDFLDEEAWTDVWSMLQFADLAPVSRTKGAWKLDDGVPLGSQEIITPPRTAELVHDPERPDLFPSETALDHVLAGILADSEEFKDLIGDAWAHVSARAYVYPRGSALSWHGDDHDLYAGAYIYYAHPHWNAHWGGELLVADMPEGRDALPIMGHRFDHESYSQAIMEQGTGHYVAPKPNRLVVIGGAPHMVAPVRAAAGDAVRASVSGFFLNGAQEQAEAGA